MAAATRQRSVDVAAYLAAGREQVNEALGRFLARERLVAIDVHPLAREVFEAVVEFTLGPGKRLRPILMMTGYRGAGGRDEAAILAASCCLELTQTFLLIHDDIMDKSELRRGRPAVHTAIASRYGSASGGLRSSDPPHFGLALAIAAGDLAGQLALRALRSAEFPPERLAQALDVYTAMTRDVCYGQVLDMHAGDRLLAVTEADVLTIHRYKTARYTTEGPLLLGAVLAGAPAGTLAALSAYALPLGQAFQLQDDLLGVFGREEETGKPADADLKQGKRTLLVLKTLEWGTPEQRQAVDGALGNGDATASQIDAARNAIEHSGAREYCRRRAVSLAAEARATLSVAEITPSARRILLGLADYMVERVS